MSARLSKGPAESAWNLDQLVATLEPPVLIVSTAVGRGMCSLGDALREHFPPEDVRDHVVVEDYLPDRAVSEDLKRYKLIADKFPFLLRVIYRVPIFYYRKLLRESLARGTKCQALKQHIEALNPGTVLCISHRPAFWVASLKRHEEMNFRLWGVLGEYGDTLGWRYIPWAEMDGFLSPLPREELSYRFPASLQFRRIDLPARRDYYRLAEQPGDPDAVLLVCGYWGQGPMLRVLEALLAVDSGLRVTVVCGENAVAREKIARVFGGRENVAVHGAVDSLLPFLAQCACVVSKPGISTLLEAHAARRKIFLLKGMPVAEDNNAAYAVEHFGATWFSQPVFRAWLHGQAV